MAGKAGQIIPRGERTSYPVRPLSGNPSPAIQQAMRTGVWSSDAKNHTVFASLMLPREKSMR